MKNDIGLRIGHDRADELKIRDVTEHDTIRGNIEIIGGRTTRDRTVNTRDDGAIGGQLVSERPTDEPTRARNQDPLPLPKILMDTGHRVKAPVFHQIIRSSGPSPGNSSSGSWSHRSR